MYLYVKAIHIIFIVTWFAGLFYMPRLLIYTVESIEKKSTDNLILINQFKLMQRRLWYGITWPSAILTLVFGGWMLYLFGSIPNWLWIKLLFVVGLYLYHYLTHLIFKQQQNDVFKYSSMQLRIWNEVATLFLVAIVFLVVVKDGLVWTKALGGLIIFILILLGAIKIYKKIRKA
ncbi:MAG TPA: CopD family protein [Chitinophagales bacterium]|nr:CopD family protein [Chitinophagales bacterium]